jgi:hypothetical protein
MRFDRFSRALEIMKLATTKTYRQNRAHFPASDLERYEGQWVAFSADGCRVVASGESIKQLSERVSAACENIDDVYLERIEMETGDIQPGGAELI